jgi:hypothetical protein
MPTPYQARLRRSLCTSVFGSLSSVVCRLICLRGPRSIPWIASLNPSRPIGLARRVLRLHSVVKPALLTSNVGNGFLTSFLSW